jgi:hypothetical protein
MAGAGRLADYDGGGICLVTRLAIRGGTYSNPYALRAFVEQARARGADRLFCLGDFGAYGAEPEAIWPVLLANGVECIAGNYEVAIGSGQTDCGCGYTDDADNAFAAIAYDYTFAHTSDGFAAWMRGLHTEHRETVDGVDLHLVHGSTLAVNDFWWESLPERQHELRVAASNADVICCTHSGLPWTRSVARDGGADRGVVGRDFAVRPLVRRGHSDGGVAIGEGQHRARADGDRRRLALAPGRRRPRHLAGHAARRAGGADRRGRAAGRGDVPAAAPVRRLAAPGLQLRGLTGYRRRHYECPGFAGGRSRRRASRARRRAGLRRRRLAVTVYEAGDTVGSHVLRWGHGRLFTPGR